MRGFAALFTAAACIAASHALYSASDDVEVLTAANFKDKVLKDEAIWCVRIYAAAEFAAVNFVMCTVYLGVKL